MTNPRPTLPAGKSCEDCKKYKVCRVIHGAVSDQVVCDWPQLQFVQAKTDPRRQQKPLLKCPNCEGTEALKNIGVGIWAGALMKCLECRHEWEDGGIST